MTEFTFQVAIRILLTVLFVTMLRLWTILGFAAVALVAAFIFRPAPILGVNGAALENSMPRTPFSARPCEQVAGGYKCAVETREASGDAIAYRVTLHGHGCWTARPIGWVPREERGPISGCITLLDYIL